MDTYIFKEQYSYYFPLFEGFIGECVIPVMSSTNVICCMARLWVRFSVSNGSVFGMFVLQRFKENPNLAGSVRVCAKRFPQLSPQILIQ